MAYKGPYVPYKEIIDMPVIAMDKAIHMVESEDHCGGFHDIALCLASNVIQYADFRETQLNKFVQNKSIQERGDGTIRGYLMNMDDPENWKMERIEKVNKDGSFTTKW